MLRQQPHGQWDGLPRRVSEPHHPFGAIPLHDALDAKLVSQGYKGAYSSYGWLGIA